MAPAGTLSAHIWLLAAGALLMLQLCSCYESQYFKLPLWQPNDDCSTSDQIRLAQGYDQAVQAIRAGLDAANTVANPVGTDKKTYNKILRMFFAMYGIAIDPEQGGNGLLQGSPDKTNFDRIRGNLQNIYAGASSNRAPQKGGYSSPWVVQCHAHKWTYLGPNDQDLSMSDDDRFVTGMGTYDPLNPMQTIAQRHENYGNGAWLNTEITNAVIIARNRPQNPQNPDGEICAIAVNIFTVTMNYPFMLWCQAALMYPATVSTRDSQIIKPGIEIDDVAIQRTMSFAWTHELAHFFTVPRSPTNLNYVTDLPDPATNRAAYHYDAVANIAKAYNQALNKHTANSPANTAEAYAIFCWAMLLGDLDWSKNEASSAYDLS